MADSSIFTLGGLSWARQNALTVWSPWKQEINLVDLVANDKWEILWPDDTAEDSDPLVENTYLQALEDKTYAAGTVLPRMFTIARRGTRKDRAESAAAKRKRVMMSYWERSRLTKQGKKLYRDGLHAGAAYAMPWVNWMATTPGGSRATMPDERMPFFMKVNPRQVFPLAYDETDRLTAGLIMRQKRVRDLRRTWKDNPALERMINSQNVRYGSEAEWLEEIWVLDDHGWAVAIGDSGLPPEWQGAPLAPGDMGAGSTTVEWVKPPEEHRLYGCPLIEMRRVTVNDQPRGALIDLVPMLKTAQNFMARLLEDLELNIYAPTVLDNIENAHEYGPGAVLFGTGNGRANILRDRPNVNFEAQQTVASIIEATRRQGFEPQQRSGDPGASISSAKGTNALMGTFNSELASMQQDFEHFIRELTQITANFDEKWCYGRKAIWGFEQNGTPFDETYDPTTTFAGDYRCNVSYGERTGLDENNFMIRVATQRNMGGMSRRDFIEKSGSSDDPLQTERDMVIEQLTDLFIAQILPQQVMNGNLAALQDFVAKLDDDELTTRAAVMNTISEMTAVPAPDQPGTLGAGGRADIMKMVRSLTSGGIPGNAEGQPPSQVAVAPGLRNALAGPARRQIAQQAPGGTAT